MKQTIACSFTKSNNRFSLPSADCPVVSKVKKWLQKTKTKKNKMGTDLEKRKATKITCT